jgi:L-lysine 2,3-aminomutase
MMQEEFKESRISTLRNIDRAINFCEEHVEKCKKTTCKVANALYILRDMKKLLQVEVETDDVLMLICSLAMEFMSHPEDMEMILNSIALELLKKIGETDKSNRRTVDDTLNIILGLN